MSKRIPTVVVHVTDGGIIEAVCADEHVRVVLVDYAAAESDEAAREMPDGELAVAWEEYLRPFPDRVADYLDCAGLSEAPRLV